MRQQRMGWRALGAWCCGLRWAAVLGAGVLLGPVVGQAQPAAAHTHGQAQLTLAQDGSTVVLTLVMPLEAAVGFERAPRTAAERQRADQALARLRLPGGGFQLDAAAACQPHHVTLEVGPLATEAARPADKARHSHEAHRGHDDHDHPAAHADAHADLEASYRFECAQPTRLRGLLTDVFEAWPRLQRLEVQLATPQGQWRQSLRRPQRSIALVR